MESHDIFVLEAVLEEAVGEDSMKWIKFELLYRDFFKLITKRAARVQARVQARMQARQEETAVASF